MAPRRGGGFHGGGGSSNSGSITSCRGCDTSVQDEYFGLYSKADLYGQLIASAIWALVLVVVFSFNFKPMGKVLQLSVFFFFASLVLQCVRFGLMIPDNWVQHNYRYEAPAQVMCEWLGIVTLFAALLSAFRASKILGGICWCAILALLGLAAASVAYDFINASAAVELWQKYDFWRLSDRDFSLTMTNYALSMYRGDTVSYTFNGFYQGRMYRLFWPGHDDSFIDRRGTQIKIDLAANVVAFVLVFLIAGAVAMMRSRQPDGNGNGNGNGKHRIWIIAAIAVLQISTVFRLVVSAHYVLPNWQVINNFSKWLSWLSAFPDTDDVFDGEHPPHTFLAGFRTTVDNFYIVRAVLEPMGFVLACALLLVARRASRKYSLQNTQPGSTVQTEWKQ